MTATKAGVGEHHAYRIHSQPSDDQRLEYPTHYLGADAVSWYINRESSWFTNRIASGTLDITLSGGTEKYSVALGTFELDRGSKTAPVFDRPVLADRAYQGGSITINAALTAVERNTAIARLLKSASSASLGIVAGMVESAAATGPLNVLVAAGSDLIGGVKAVLSDDAPKREALFDFSGLEVTIQPIELTAPEMYLLLHRGSNLDEKVLGVAKLGGVSVPTTSGSLLIDGAWLMLRLRRSAIYSGYRPWMDAARAFNSDLAALTTGVSMGAIGRAAALTEFKQTATGKQTMYDRLVALQAIIRSDSVLTEAEAFSRAALYSGAMSSARSSILAGVSSKVTPVEDFAALVSDERPLPQSMVDALVRDVEVTMEARALRTPSRRPQDLARFHAGIEGDSGLTVLRTLLASGAIESLV